MDTSYFARYKGSTGVSISAKSPVGWKGKEYKKLAPKYWFLMQYKEDRNKEHYIHHYKKEVLDKLDPQTVYDELGHDAVLLCYEKPSDFCHRHIVAEWLNESLGLYISEL